RAGRAAAGAAGAKAKDAAREARRVPGVTQAEGEAKGAVASEEDLPITGYDSKNAGEIVARLGDLSQIDLGKIDAYERRHQNRTTVLQKIDSLRGSEPWAGYDEESVDEIAGKLSDEHADKADQVRDYERRHKNRTGVLEAAERHTVRA
ncbi:MAG TPA: hypothetical protein VGR10_02370, partial [Thermoleophilaceae bacterium]|nr:hypothetical protein [Thermoleophilaceae bacterium]